MLRGWPPLLEAFHQKKHSFHLPGDDFSINWELSTQLKKGTFDGTSHKLFYMESLFLVALSPRLGCLNSLRTSSQHFFFGKLSCGEFWRLFFLSIYAMSQNPDVGMKQKPFGVGFFSRSRGVKHCSFDEILWCLLACHWDDITIHHSWVSWSFLVVCFLEQ